jgi:hypothetical protein
MRTPSSRQSSRWREFVIIRRLRRLRTVPYMLLYSLVRLTRLTREIQLPNEWVNESDWRDLTELTFSQMSDFPVLRSNYFQRLQHALNQHHLSPFHVQYLCL